MANVAVCRCPCTCGHSHGKASGGTCAWCVASKRADVEPKGPDDWLQRMRIVEGLSGVLTVHHPNDALVGVDHGIYVEVAALQAAQKERDALIEQLVAALDAHQMPNVYRGAGWDEADQAKVLAAAARYAAKVMGFPRGGGP